MKGVDAIEVARLRRFVVVAEERNFTRAAKAMHISLQQLSQIVLDLEHELEITLFVPGARPKQLTGAGQELLDRATAIVTSADSDVIDKHAEPNPGLRVGVVPGVTVSKWERIWGQRFPDTPLETVPIPQAEQLAALHSGLVDMCFVRMPIDKGGLEAIPLYQEKAVVVVPADHPISLFTEVESTDLAEERQQDTTDLDDAAMAIELVAAGVGAAVVPHSIARLHTRRDVVYRPVSDLAPTEIALAWPTAATTETVEEFIGVVRGRSERSARSPSGRRPNEGTDNSRKRTADGRSTERGPRSRAAKKPQRRRKR